MTPDEPRPTPLDGRVLEQLLACDAFVHNSAAHSTADHIDTTADFACATSEADDRGRGRLMLLLTMLEAVETAAELPATSLAEPDECGTAGKNHLLLGAL